jgi:hypothetical protein
MGLKQCKRKALNTQSGQEHTANALVDVALPVRRFFFSTFTVRNCCGTAKKHSTQNAQFAYALFLFLLPGVWCSFLSLLCRCVVTVVFVVVRLIVCRARARFFKSFKISKLKKFGV